MKELSLPFIFISNWIKNGVASIGVEPASGVDALLDRLEKKGHLAKQPEKKELVSSQLMFSRYELLSLCVLACFLLAQWFTAYLPVWVAPWLCYVLAGFCLFCLFGQTVKQRMPHRALAFCLVTGVAFFTSLLWVQAQLNDWVTLSQWMLSQNGREVTITGRFLPQKQGGVLAVDSQRGLRAPPSRYPLRLKLEGNDLLDSGQLTELPYGASLRLRGTLYAPRQAEFAGQFNEWAYLTGQGVIGKVRVIPDATSTKSFFQVLPEQRVRLSLRLMRWVEGYRVSINNSFRQALGDNNGAVLAGLVLGERASPVAPAVKEAFTATGLLHLLAASGMNVAIVAGFVFWGLGLLRLPHRLALLVVMGIVILYSLLTGLPPSIMRAATMILIALFLKLLHYRLPGLLLLLTAFAIILLWQPYSIYSLGLLLSVLTTMGIISAWPLVERLKQSLHNKKVAGLVNLIVNLIWVSLAAQLWAWPLLVQVFNQIPLHSLLLNVIAIGLVGPLTIIGFSATGLLLLAPALVPWLLKPAGVLTSLLLNTSQWGQAQSWAMLHIASPGPWMLAVLYATLLWLLVAGHPGLALKARTIRYGLLGFLLVIAGLYVSRQPFWQSSHQLNYLPLGYRASAWVFQPAKGGQAPLLVIGLGALNEWWQADNMARYISGHYGGSRVWLLLQGPPPAAFMESLLKELKPEALVFHASSKRLQQQEEVVALLKKHQVAYRLLEPGRQLQLHSGASETTLEKKLIFEAVSQWPERKASANRKYYPLRLTFANLLVNTGAVSTITGEASHWVYVQSNGYPQRWYLLPGTLLADEQKQVAQQLPLDKALRLEWQEGDPASGRQEAIHMRLQSLAGQEPPFNWVKAD